MRRERRGGDADAEAPQAFKEGASTLRNAQNRTQFSCSAAAWGVMGVEIGFQCLGRKKKGGGLQNVCRFLPNDKILLFGNLQLLKFITELSIF